MSLLREWAEAEMRMAVNKRDRALDMLQRQLDDARRGFTSSLLLNSAGPLADLADALARIDAIGVVAAWKEKAAT